MEFIDMHSHIYPDDIAYKAAKSVQSFYGGLGGEGDMDGTAGMLLRRGKEAGISRFLILPVAIRPDRVQGINDYIVGQVKAHPEFVGFGTVHARMEGLLEETERIISLGLRGIKMHPDSQRFAIDDPALLPMYELARDKGLPVMLHMGDLRYHFSQPILLKRVLEQIPGLKAIATHFGGYSVYEEAFQTLRNMDCVFDTSSSLMLLEPGAAERYINGYGAERMAFGTDYPMWDPMEERKRFDALKLTDDQKEQIANKTAKRVLGLG